MLFDGSAAVALSLHLVFVALRLVRFVGTSGRVRMNSKRGRKPTERGAYNPNPARQFGRISDEDWQEIKEACEASGKSLVEWGLPVLLAKAKREKKQRGK